MKLTTTQITTIDETLVLNGLIYDDIKLEVTDHIASEIEAKMEENNSSFDEALYEVLLNWKEQMKPSYSFWTGSKNVAPRIVIDKLISNSKRQYFKGLAIGFFMAILVTFIAKNNMNEIVFEDIRKVFQFVFRAELVLLLVCQYLIWKSKQTTSYGFLFKKQIFTIMFFLFLLGIGLLPIKLVNPDFALNIVLNFFLTLYLILPISYLKLAYKHFQFERKIKLSE